MTQGFGRDHPSAHGHEKAPKAGEALHAGFFSNANFLQDMQNVSQPVIVLQYPF